MTRKLYFADKNDTFGNESYISLQKVSTLARKSQFLAKSVVFGEEITRFLAKAKFKKLIKSITYWQGKTFLAKSYV